MLETIKLTARGQDLECKKVLVASGLVNEIYCNFTTDWDVDVTEAIFENSGAHGRKISMPLNGAGVCKVPHELMEEKGNVEVNLVGLEVREGALVRRMTSHKALCIVVDEVVNLSGDNTVPPTPSEFELFVEIVGEDAEAAEKSRFQAEIAKTDAQTAAGTAVEAATEAEEAKRLAHASEEMARSYKDSARSSAEYAGTAAQTATEKAANASESAKTAEQSAAAAQTAKVAAETAKSGAQSAKTDAEAAKSAAQTAKAGAETAKADAIAAKNQAVAAKTDAETAKTAAQTAKTDAETAKAGAQSAKADAEAAKSAAQTAKTDAETAKAGAQSAKADAEAAKTAAQTAKTDAETAKTAAQAAKSDAEEARDDVAGFVEGMAQEPTQLTIEEKVEIITGLLEYIVEHGISGSLNGFELNMDSDTHSIIISYQDPDTQEIYEPAQAPTETTGNEIVDKLKDINRSLKIIADREV